jgi:hypothetical protein
MTWSMRAKNSAFWACVFRANLSLRILQIASLAAASPK